MVSRLAADDVRAPVRCARRVDPAFGFLDALFRFAPASGGPLAEGFRAMWENEPDVPLLLLNGFSVQDGCKFVTTPIDGNGPESDSLNCVVAHDGVVVPSEPSEGRPGFLSGSRVFTDLLCAPDDEVRLSTAALLSARFPTSHRAGAWSAARNRPVPSTLWTGATGRTRVPAVCSSSGSRCGR
jgi:hypothetical protein